ncbi:dihydropteroate synthase [Methylomagnum sp.]
MNANEKRHLIMGILNVTPDSFSDGGVFQGLFLAASHALNMVNEGADIIDIGGESTRPGSDPVSADEQIKRVVPVISKIRELIPRQCLISVDTTLTAVAEAAVAAGADIVNDVSAGRNDPHMFDFVAAWGGRIVLMHMQGTPKTMQDNPSYSDVVDEVCEFLRSRADAAIAAGIKPENIILDPGIGFGKTRQHNLLLMTHLERITHLGFPVLLGTSRKRFMGAICGETEPTGLLGATVATTAYGVMKGVRIFRVHDVRENRQAADVIAAIGGAV